MATYPSPDLWPSPLLDPGQTPTAQVAWAPTLEDVGAKAASLTVEGMNEEQAGGDTPDGYLVFNQDTRPNDRQVSLAIAGAIAEVAGRAGQIKQLGDVGYDTDPTGLNRWADLARQCAAWNVVMTIYGDRHGAQADDTVGTYTAAERQFLGLMAALERKANRAAPGLI